MDNLRDRTNDDYFELLKIVAENQNLEIAQLLTENFSNENSEPKDNFKLLKQAAEIRDIQVAKIVVANIAKKRRIDN